MLQSHYFLHIVAAITEGFTPSRDKLFCSLLVWVRLCCHWPSCHCCTRLAIIFTSVTATILLQRWNQMKQARRQLPLTSHNRRMFFNYVIIPRVSLISDRIPYFSDQQVFNRRDTKEWPPFRPKGPLLIDFPDKQGWANAWNSCARSASPNSYIQHSIIVVPTLAKITEASYFYFYLTNES